MIDDDWLQQWVCTLDDVPADKKHKENMQQCNDNDYQDNMIMQ